MKEEGGGGGKEEVAVTKAAEVAAEVVVWEVKHLAHSERERLEGDLRQSRNTPCSPAWNEICFDCFG